MKSGAKNSAVRDEQEVNRVFYLKVNSGSISSLFCMKYWVDVATCLNAAIYFICDKPNLKKDITEKIKLPLNCEFIRSDQKLQSLTDALLKGARIDCGSQCKAHLTPFFHSVENNFSISYSVDADDLLCLCRPEILAMSFRKAENIALTNRLDILGLDLLCSRTFGIHWSFGIVICLNPQNCISVIKRNVDFRDKIPQASSLGLDYLKDWNHNIDWVLTYLRDTKQLKVGAYYVENLGVTHIPDQLLFFGWSYLMIYRNGWIEYPIVKDVVKDIQNSKVRIDPSVYKITDCINENEYRDFMTKMYHRGYIGFLKEMAKLSDISHKRKKVQQYPQKALLNNLDSILLKPVRRAESNLDNSAFMELGLDKVSTFADGRKPIDLLKGSRKIGVSCSLNWFKKVNAFLPNLLGHAEIYCQGDLVTNAGSLDLILLMGGLGSTEAHKQAMITAMQIKKPLLIVESSFLRSIVSFAEANSEPKYQSDLGFVFDYQAAYYDSTRPSSLECMLNDESLSISVEERERARKCLDRITSEYLSKYNHQPIVSPTFKLPYKKKILVVDQSFGDNSVKYGGCGPEDFEEMLFAAYDENPNSEIIVKTHPDTVAGRGSGYFSSLKPFGRITLLTDPVNPISLLKAVDEVYVCTSQMGLEALFCGKKVHTFGIPFYSGWGLTDDRRNVPRRHRKRDLEELFYITYILYSHYL